MKAILFFGVFISLQSLFAESLDLNSLKGWVCGPDAPGGGIKIDVEKKILCDFSLPGQCNDPKSTSRSEIIQMRMGQLQFEDTNIPFVEYKAINPTRQLQFLRIYSEPVNGSQSYRGEGIPRWSFPLVDNPLAPFTINSNELRCNPIF